MAIPTPLLSVYDRHRGVSRLVFSEADQERIPNGDYRMAGGICWPIRMDATVAGFALVAGEHVETKRLYVFEEQPYVVIDHIIDRDGKIAWRGLCEWFPQMWQRYHAVRYYHRQPGEGSRTYQLEVRRNPMIEPKPYLIEVPPFEVEHGLRAIWERRQVGRLFADREGIVMADATRAEVTPGGQLPPAMHALMVCVLGVQRYPYREPKSDDD
jgi:hypothetical protein